MLFCWFTTRRRIIGLGYGWLLRGVYFCFALGALAAGPALRRRAGPRGGFGRCRDRPASAALGVSIVRRKAGVSGQQEEFDRRSERVAAMTGIERTVVTEAAGRRRSRRTAEPSSRRCSTSCRSIIGAIGLIAAALDAGGNTAGRADPHARRRRVHRSDHRRDAARPLVPRAARPATPAAQRDGRRPAGAVAARDARAAAARSAWSP